MSASRIPPHLSGLRYLEAVRRAKIARIAAVGALVVVPAACSNGDAAVFEAATQAASISAETPTATEAAPVSEPAAETPAATAAATADASTTIVPETTAVVAASGVFPTGGELVVDFTYSAGGGRIRNPYIAVWVEDESGTLVDTVSLWFLQEQKGTRWLGHLTKWAAAYGGESVDSGATRSAGSYSVAWDGNDMNGAPVAAGTYTLLIESAREHGPHSVTSTQFTVSADGFSITVPDSGELSAITATLQV